MSTQADLTERLAFLRDTVTKAEEALLQAADAIRDLAAHVDTLTAERDAYKRAKEENGFMCERDEARRERDDLAAALANERGEGEPPSDRWTWCPIRRMWWANETHLEPCPDGYRWANILTNEEARTSKILSDGVAPSQRAAMRAADAAVPLAAYTAAPEVPHADR